MSDNGTFLFAESGQKQSSTPTKQAPLSRWKVLVVDDEVEVHAVTKMVLADFEFAGRGLDILSAYTGKEACEMMREHPDIAMILLDVVMETDCAGLDVVRYIRDDLKNQFVRIVLRTGQPGQAPESDVIVNYDINDYKAKTELTAQKLFTLMHANLRSYRDILAIERNKRGLEEVVHALDGIFHYRSMARFVEGLMTQLTSLLHLDETALIADRAYIATSHDPGSNSITVIAATGRYQGQVGQELNQIEQHAREQIMLAFQQKTNIYDYDECVAYCANRFGDERVLYFTGVGDLSLVERRIIDIFLRNASTCFDNISLYEKHDRTQREIIALLGGTVESRSKETGAHIQRVAGYSRMLAIKLGLSVEEVDIIKMASPLHDIGKIAIPDAVLNKPGKLSAEEWALMQTHAEEGHKLLSQQDSDVFNAAAVIAKEHHEKWDGSGYPAGLKGEAIHIYGRITALADVVDALSSDRCYKKAWPMEQVLELVKAERGKHFDPQVVDAFLENLDEFLEIRACFSD